jgi:hypothetical protein
MFLTGIGCFSHSRNLSCLLQIFCIRQILEKNGIIIVQYISYVEMSEKSMIQLERKNYTGFSVSFEWPRK